MAWRETASGKLKTVWSKPLICLNPKQGRLGFNRAFIKEADLEKKEFVNIYIDNKTFQIGFVFHNDPTRYGARRIYKMFDAPAKTKQDGDNTKEGLPDREQFDKANRKNRAMFLKIGLILREHSWVKEAVLSSGNLYAKYKPVEDRRLGGWAIQLQPSLGEPMSMDVFKKTVKRDQIGVYALYDSFGKIIYYGEGRILQRVKIHIKNYLDIASVSFVVAPNGKQEGIETEHRLLEEFKLKNEGRTPPHNKNAGYSRTRKKTLKAF